MVPASRSPILPSTWACIWSWTVVFGIKTFWICLFVVTLRYQMKCQWVCILDSCVNFLLTGQPHSLRGARQDIPGELLRAWICWHCVWTSGFCVFYVLGCLSVGLQTEEKRPVLWVSTQFILVCGRWESWVTWLFEQERIHRTCFAKKQTWLFRTTCEWTQ